jgi:hypothetical protein
MPFFLWELFTLERMPGRFQLSKLWSYRQQFGNNCNSMVAQEDLPFAIKKSIQLILSLQSILSEPEVGLQKLHQQTLILLFDLLVLSDSSSVYAATQSSTPQ